MIVDYEDTFEKSTIKQRSTFVQLAAKVSPEPINFDNTSLYMSPKLINLLNGSPSKAVLNLLYIPIQKYGFQSLMMLVLVTSLPIRVMRIMEERLLP